MISLVLTCWGIWLPVETGREQSYKTRPRTVSPFLERLVVGVAVHVQHRGHGVEVHMRPVLADVTRDHAFHGIYLQAGHEYRVSPVN